jgi:hypothetical protein
MVLGLHATALQPRTESAFAAYTPNPADVPERLAAWSANLVVLATVAAGELPVLRIFPSDAEDAIERWHRQAKLWRAVLSGDGWYGFVKTIGIRRGWRNGDRILTLSLGGTNSEPPHDLAWTSNGALGPYSNAGYIALKSNALVSTTQDTMNHALAPFTEAFPTFAHHLLVQEDDEIVSASHVLAEALVNPTEATFQLLGGFAVVVRTANEEDGERYLNAAYRAAVAALQTGNLSQEGFDALAEVLARSHRTPDIIGRPRPALEASPLPSPTPAT